MTEVPGDFIPVPVGLLDNDPGLLPEVNMYLRAREPWSLVDEDIDCLEGRGSPQFWEDFMKRKHSDA